MIARCKHEINVYVWLFLCIGLFGVNVLHIYGSLTLDPNMIMNYDGKLSFESTNQGNTIATANHNLYSEIIFDSKSYSVIVNI